MDLEASELIDDLIAGLSDWRGRVFTRLRETILAADADIVEEWKWMGSPVWSCDGIVAVANPHKGKVKLTFAHGAHIPDPNGLFNAGLEGNARRAIDIFEGDAIDEPALQALVKAAITYNRGRRKNTATANRTKAGRRNKA
ncbi:MAG: DUF1801 domain-containing protein [Bauldia sp.]|nr:DUF1801 domain-containing protein [Bauldia sp.]